MSEPRRLPTWGSLALTAFGLAVLTPALGSARVLTHHETFNTQPAREMLETGQWVVPTFGGTTIAERPPLTIWVIAGVLAFVGGVDEFAIRLPFVAAAILTANLIARLAARLHGPRIGLIAGGVQLTTFYVFMQSRLAEPDMLLCAAVTLALTAFCEGVVLRYKDTSLTASAARGHESELAQNGGPAPKRAETAPRGSRLGLSWAFAFYFGVGLAFLAKGPVGGVFIVAAIGLYLITRVIEERSLGEVGRTIRFGLSPAGSTVAAVCILGWPAAAVWTRPDLVNDWLAENLGRFSGELGHRQHPLFYAAMLPALLLPWTPFVVGGWWVEWKRGESGGGSLAADAARLVERRRRNRFLFCWTTAGLAVLQAAAFKHKHYLIPLLPPLSIVAAVGFDAWTRIAWRGRWPAITVATAAGVTIFAAAVALPREMPEVADVLLPAVLLSLGGAAAAFVIGTRVSPRSHVLTAFATVAAVGVLVETRVIPRFDSYRDQATFARRVNAVVPDETPIEVVGLPENHVTAYLRGPLAIHDDPAGFLPRTPTEGPRYAVMFAREAESLGPLARVVDRCDTLRKRETEETRLVLVEVGGAVRVAGGERAVR